MLIGCVISICIAGYKIRGGIKSPSKVYGEGWLCYLCTHLFCFVLFPLIGLGRLTRGIRPYSSGLFHMEYVYCVIAEMLVSSAALILLMLSYNGECHPIGSCRTALLVPCLYTGHYGPFRVQAPGDFTYRYPIFAWWRHEMETFSAWLALLCGAFTYVPHCNRYHAVISLNTSSPFY